MFKRVFKELIVLLTICFSFVYGYALEIQDLNARYQSQIHKSPILTTAAIVEGIRTDASKIN